MEIAKAFLAVKETYKGTKIKMLACVVHVQKRVGCRLRNLKKKMLKDFQGRGSLLML